MAPPITRPVTCPVLIGRAAYLEAVAAALDGAQQGEGHTIVVSGEAGIGKSRLLSEVGNQAAQRGFARLLGNAYEADRDVPFAPLSDLLRSRLATGAHDELDRLLGSPSGHYLSDLLPELADHLSDRAPSAPADPEQRKRRLYAMLDEAFLGIARDRPVLLAVEDLHWADATSLDYLLHLARRIAGRPVMLVVTYRSDEVHPALRHFLAGLDRERLASEIALAPLDRAEVGDMLRAIFGLARPPRADLLAALYALTEGNPFFIEEVLHILVAEGDIFYADGRWDRKPLDEIQIPRSVHDTVQRRALGLSADAGRVLNLAAVLGRRWDFALLQTVGGYDEARLLMLLKELIAAQLIIEESDEHYRFRHALTRQAVYAELLARERRVLHRGVAETLERLAGDAPEAALPELAYHFFAAGVWEKAAVYSQAVGERALALFSPGAAVEHFTRALEAFERQGVVPPAAVLRARGGAHETLGNFERALGDYERAVELAHIAGDWRAEWQTLLDQGMLWSGRDYARAVEYYRRAKERADASGDAAATARSLNSLGNWLLNVDQPTEAIQHHEAALAAFEALGDQRGIAETLDFLGMTHYVSSDLIQGTRSYERGVALMRELNERKLLASALATMPLRGATVQTDSMVPVMGPAAARVEGYEGLAIAREIGWLAGETYAHMQLGSAAVALGEYGRAFEHVQAGRAIATEIEHRQWLSALGCIRGYLLLDLFALDEAEGTLIEALSLARAIGSHAWIGCTAGTLALCYTQRSRLGEATAVLNDALPPGIPMQTLGQRMAWCSRIQLTLARDEPEHALRLADELAAATPNAASPDDIPRVSWLRGRALAALSRYDEAERSLLAAERHARVNGARPVLWRVQADLCALALARGGPRDDGREASIRETLAALARNIPDPALREPFLAGTSARLPALQLSARPASRRSTAEAPGGLTAREREVAALVAGGLANRAIAERLVVGERTVESHVTNILGKLGFTNRAQIAAWAVAHDLARGESDRTC